MTDRSGIRSSTRRAAGAIDGISATIQGIDRTASAIAAAVSQQDAATRDIVGSATRASLGMAEVSADISGVTRAEPPAGGAAGD